MDEEKRKKQTKFFRFSGGGFQYNLQVAIFLIPCLICFLTFGGTITVSTIMVGMLFVYFFDIINQPHVAFVCVWVFTLITELGLLYRGIELIKISIWNIFSITIIALFCLVMAIWITLQFKWLRNLSVESMIILERVLLGVLPVLSSSVLTYAGVVISGPSIGPVLLLTLLSFSYYLLGVPLEPSFKSNFAALKGEHASGMFESIANTVILFLMPTIYHIALYHRVIFSFQHLVAIAFYISASIILVRYLQSKYNALWWIGSSPLAKNLNNTLLFISFLLLIFCFEYRVFFVSFYYSLPLFPPLNYIIVTIATYSLSGIALLVIFGHARKIPFPIAAVIASVGGFFTSLALSLPFLAYVLSIIAAIGLTHFYYKRNLVSYFVFIITITGCVILFVRKNYWYIDYHFGGVMDISLKELSIMLVGTFVFSMLLPGLCFDKKYGGVILILHAINLLRVECILYGRNQDIYPGYILLITCIFGLKLTQHLHKEKIISSISAWIAYSVSVSKLVLFVSDDALAVPSFLLTVLFTISPFFLYEINSMTNIHIIGQFVAILVAVILSKSAVVAPVFTSILSHPPSNILITSSIILYWAVLNLPMAISVMPNLPVLRSSLFTVIIAILGFFLCQPELGLFSSINSPMTSSHGWFFLIIIILTIVSWRSRSMYVRLFYVVVTGIWLGMFIVLSSINAASSLFYIAFIITSILTLLLILFILSPHPKISPILPIAYIAYHICILCILLVSSMSVSGYGMRRSAAVTSVRTATLMTYAGTNLFFALIAKYHVTTTTKSLKWAPNVCNFSAIIGLISAFVVNIVYLKGSETSLLFLSPFLLLLTRDNYLFKNLNKDNRYLPIVVAFFISFIAYSFYSIWAEPLLLSRKLFMSNLFSSLLSSVLTLCSVPSQLYFISFLFDFKKQNKLTWVMVTPLNILCFFSGVRSAYYLGILSILYAVLQFFLSLQIQKTRKNTI